MHRPTTAGSLADFLHGWNARIVSYFFGSIKNAASQFSWGEAWAFAVFGAVFMERFLETREKGAWSAFFTVFEDFCKNVDAWHLTYGTQGGNGL